MKISALQMVILGATLLGTARAVSVDDFAPRRFNSGQGVLPYRLFIPAQYTPAQQYPLVLFLHGAGECGTDNRYQLVGQTGCLVFASEENQSKYPSFMVAPQCPVGLSWESTSIRLLVLGMLSALKAEFSVDTNRLYITGLSLGGYGTWDYLAQNPDLYAAAIPMSGGGNSGTAARLTQIPIWNFHAADDGVVYVGNSRSIISGLRRVGGHPIYTEYASGGHVIWTPAYNTPVLMDWIFAQKRGGAPATEPSLGIASPMVAAATWTTSATNLTLTGTAEASGELVTRVSWTNFANNMKGLAEGAGAWNIAGIPLQVDKTNMIVIAAATTSWVPDYGGSTTFNHTLAVIQSPIRASLIFDGTMAALEWTGGGSPFAVQRATDLAVEDWTDFLPNATAPVVVPLTDQAGLYRVVGN